MCCKAQQDQEQSQHSLPSQDRGVVSPPSPAPLSALAAVTPISQNTQAALQLGTVQKKLGTVQIKPSLIPAALQVQLQLWTPCSAHHKVTQFKIHQNKDIAGTLLWHGLKLRAWPNPNILSVERNDGYNLKPSQGLVTRGLPVAGSTVWCRASSNPPEV